MRQQTLATTLAAAVVLALSGCSIAGATGIRVSAGLTVSQAEARITALAHVQSAEVHDLPWVSGHSTFVAVHVDADIPSREQRAIVSYLGRVAYSVTKERTAPSDVRVTVWGDGFDMRSATPGGWRFEPGASAKWDEAVLSDDSTAGPTLSGTYGAWPNTSRTLDNDIPATLRKGAP